MTKPKFDDVFSARCDVTFDPEDHGLHAKADGRDRGLWFYAGPPTNDWAYGAHGSETPSGFPYHPVLVTWDHLARLYEYLEKELSARSGIPLTDAQVCASLPEYPPPGCVPFGTPPPPPPAAKKRKKGKT